MKKIYSLLLLLAGSGVCVAQPTLTAANSNPLIGQSFEKKLFTPVANQHGNAGANQVWDWSGVTEDISGTGEIVNPIGTPYYSTYPSSNICYQVFDGSYEYHLANSAGLYRLGFQSPAAGISNVYTNNVKLMQYPFSMNGTYTDTYAANVGVPGDTGTFSGSVTVTADGWGTLITPSGTYTNVLRVHAAFSEIYLYDIFGPITQTFDQYTYWQPDAHFPLAEYTVGLQGGAPFSSASWTVATVGINELAAENYKLSVYPNPVNTSAEITYTLTKSSDVSLVINDVTGRTIQSLKPAETQPGKHAVPVNAASFSNGIYLVAITIDGETATTKMIVAR